MFRPVKQNSMRIFQTNKKIYILLALFFVASLSYSFYYRIKPVVDASAYDRVGYNLSRGCGYVESNQNCGHPERDDAIGRVGPGYQFFLAGVYFVFGHKIWIVWFFHALFRAITAFVIYKIALFVFEENTQKEKIGILAAIFFGFMPDLIVYNAMLLIETLFLLLFSLAIYFLLRSYDSTNSKTILLASFFLSFGIMTRPTPFLVLAVAFLIFLFTKKIKFAFLLLLFPILLIAPWAYRNFQLHERIILTSTTGGYDLWVGNNPEATGGFDKTDEIAQYRRVNGLVLADKKGWEEYFKFIREEPLKFIDLQYDKAAIYFSALRPTGFWAYLGTWGQVMTLGASFLATFFLFGFGLSGFFSMGEDLINSTRKRFFVLFGALQPLAVIPVIVETRYRAAFFIFLAISAAYMMVKLIFNRANRGRVYRMLSWSFGILFLIIFWDAVNNIILIKEKLINF